MDCINEINTVLLPIFGFKSLIDYDYELRHENITHAMIDKLNDNLENILKYFKKRHFSLHKSNGKIENSNQAFNFLKKCLFDTNILHEIYEKKEKGVIYKCMRLKQQNKLLYDYINTMVTDAEIRCRYNNDSFIIIKTVLDKLKKEKNKTIGEKMLEYILRHPTKPFDWAGITCNPNITFDIVEKYSDIPWSYTWLSLNPNLTMDYVKRHPDKRWDWASLFGNKSIAFSDIMENIPHDIYSGCISTLIRNMPIDENTEKYMKDPLCWICLSENPNLTMDYVEKHSDKPWCWGAISANAKISEAYIESHLDKPWDWINMTSNPNIPLEYIDKHPERIWGNYCLSHNTQLTQEYIEKHPEIEWNRFGISACPNITLEFIEKHTEIDWYWNFISGNPNVTMEYIEKHPEKDWNWFTISRRLFTNNFNKIAIEQYFSDIMGKHINMFEFIYKNDFKCKLIGEGAYGMVFKCKKDATRFVIKAIHCDGSENTELEISDKLKELKSQHINTYIAHFIVNSNDLVAMCGKALRPLQIHVGNYLMLVSEYMNKKDLLEFTRNNEITTEQWRAFLFQIISTLAKIHEKYPTFVHNALKLNDVLLECTCHEQLKYEINGKKYSVPNYGYNTKITDYGFSNIDGQVENTKIREEWCQKLGLHTDKNLYYDVCYVLFTMRRFLAKELENQKEVIEFIGRIVPDKYANRGKNTKRMIVKDEYTTPLKIIEEDIFFEKYRINF